MAAAAKEVVFATKGDFLGMSSNARLECRVQLRCANRGTLGARDTQLCSTQGSSPTISANAELESARKHEGAVKTISHLADLRKNVLIASANEAFFGGDK